MVELHAGPRRTGRAWPRAVLMIAVLAMVVAACGGDEEPSAGGAPTDVEPTDGAEATDEDVAVEEDDDWPDDTIRWIVPSSAGGGFDVNTRLFADHYAEELGVNFSIENIAGGNFAIGTLEALRGRGADECNTILTHGAELLTIASLAEESEYSVDDFYAIGGVTSEEYVFRVHDDTPWQTVEELVEDARSRPGEIRYGVGSMTDSVGFHRFMLATDTDFNVILYDGGGEARLGMRNGEIEVAHIGVFNGLAIEDVSRVIGIDHHENRWPEYTDDATPINDQLGTDLDPWLNTNGFFVTAACRENHPQRYERLVEAFRVVADDEDYIASLEDADVHDLRLIQPGEEYNEYVEGLREPISEVLEEVDLGV